MRQKPIHSNEELMQSGSFGQLIARLCVPSILVMLVTVLYHMADVFFVGQTGDANKVAAVSLASPLFTILSGFGVLLGNGGCTAISLQLGKGNADKVKKCSAFAFWGAVMLGFVFMIVVLCLMTPICSLLGTNENTLQYTVEYLQVIALGAPVMMLTNVIPALIRADGSTINSMIGNLTGTLLNIVLDPILIVTLNMGVRGAAIATVVSSLAALVYYVYFMLKKRDIYSIAPKDFTLKKDIGLNIILLGMPICFSTVLSSISSAISNNFMMEYGSIAISAQKVAGNIGMIVTMIVMGICMGMQPAISFSYGANNKKRLTNILTKLTIMAVSCGALLAIVCLLFRNQLLAMFLKGATEDYLSIGRVCLLASVITGPFYGFYQLCTTYLQSTGKSKKAILVSLMEKGIVYIPALLLMRLIFGMYGVIFAGTATTLVSSIVALYYCYHDFSRELKARA